MSRSLLNQFAQVKGAITSSDDLTMALAELAGRSKTTGLTVNITGNDTITVTSGGLFELADEGNYVVISGSAYEISAYTNTTTVTVAGSPTNGTGFNADLHYYKNLEDDINYIRTQLKSIGGGSNWNDVPNIAATVSGTPYNIFYADADGNIASTGDMTYNPVSNNQIKIGYDGLNRIVMDNDDGLIDMYGWGNQIVLSIQNQHLKIGTSSPGAEIDEVLNVTDGGSIDASSDDSQLVTAKLIYNTISGVSSSSHTHYDKDGVWVGSNDEWTVTDASIADAVPDNLQVFLNGQKNKNDAEYYTTAASGTTLTIAFAYTTYETDWVNVTYTA